MRWFEGSPREDTVAPGSGLFMEAPLSMRRACVEKNASGNERGALMSTDVKCWYEERGQAVVSGLFSRVFRRS